MKGSARNHFGPVDTQRRRILKVTATAAGGLAVSLAIPGCGGGVEPAAPTTAAFQPETAKALPLLEVRGSDFEIGLQIGRQFSGEIRGGLEARGEWWTDLLAFAKSQPPEVYDSFLAAAKKHTPEVLEELRGWAEGSGVPFRELMVLNLKAEYEALRRRSMGARPTEPPEEVPGCSSIVWTGDGNLLAVHNEDGHRAYSERMFLLSMHPAGRPSVLAVSYPGILPGNAPWINSAGVMMTTNYIPSREVELGVGRYFLDRQAMVAENADRAVEICSHPDRAYAYHHVIGSRSEKRLLGLEVTPSKLEKREIDGLYLHTNHLVLPTMAGEPQIEAYVEKSSMSRWEVLNRWKAGLPDPPALGGADLIAVLSSHENRPYSPCRHPEEGVDGATLLNALFDLGSGTLRIHKGNPCLGVHTDYPLPA